MLYYVKVKSKTDNYFIDIVHVKTIEFIHMALLNLCFNRQLEERNNKKEAEKFEIKYLKAKLAYAKAEAILCYKSLNRSEQYFYGPEEDAKVVAKLHEL
jgi:hypothetical protein